MWKGMAEKGKEQRSIDDRLRLSLLYDFYGALLKDNQRRMFASNILEDYNYTEIAEEEGITRQGAYDAIRRATKQLQEYEEKLGLVARFEEQKVLAGKLHEKLRELPVAEEDVRWQEIFGLLEQILDS